MDFVQIVCCVLVGAALVWFAWLCWATRNNTSSKLPLA